MQFVKPEDTQFLESLKREWRSSLNSPPDGMWESFREQAEDYVIIIEDQVVGYASIHESELLIQFYVVNAIVPRSPEILKTFIEENKVTKGMVGTNNPVFMTAAFPHAIRIAVDTYLFREFYKVELVSKEGILQEGEMEDLEQLIDFYHQSIGADRGWLKSYLGNRLMNKELFYFRSKDSLIGACEVRTSSSDAGYADIGMLVSPDYRMQGYGSFLLSKAKSLAMARGQKPICSCEADNIGSFKSITNAGFYSNYQLLKVEF